MHRRTTSRLQQQGTATTANHYRTSHTRYIQPSDMGLAAGNRFDPIFSATALRTATFAQTAEASRSATKAFSSLPELSEFLKEFTAGNTALHATKSSSSSSSSSSQFEHRHDGLDAAYSAITRAEEIFTSLIEHQLSEKVGVHSATSTTAALEGGKVSAAGVSDDIKLQFATIAATKISLLTNHFNHFGSGASLAMGGAAARGSSSDGVPRPAFTNISHPAMSTRQRVKVETEVILTAVKALSLFATPFTATASASSSASSSSGGLGPRAAAAFPFLREATTTAGDATADGTDNAPTAEGVGVGGADGTHSSSRSELFDRLGPLMFDAKRGGFLSGRLTLETAASAQLLDSFAYLLSTFTFSLAKLKEIAPDSPTFFDGSQWSVFGSSSSASHLTKSEKAMRDAMSADSPRFFELVQSFRLGDANWLLKDVIRTYLNMGGTQTAVDSRIPELTFATASVVNVVRSSCQQTAARLCVTSSLLRVLLDGNLVEAQKDVLRGRKLLTMAYNNGHEEEKRNKVTAAGTSPALVAQEQNAAGHAVLGQQLLSCPLSLLIGEFGQSLAFGSDEELGKGSSLEGGATVGSTSAYGAGNQAYGKLSGSDFSTIKHLHNRVNLFSMMSKNDANKRPIEGGLFLSLNAEILARKSYGTYGPNQMDGPLADLYNDAVEYYRGRVEDDAKTDSLSLNASSVLSPPQKALLREQRAAEQDHYASALFAAGNFYLAGTPRPPPKTNKEQDRRIWDAPHTELAYLQTPLVGTMAGSNQLFVESVRGGLGGGNSPNELGFDSALKRAQQLLERALQLTRSASSTYSATAAEAASAAAAGAETGGGAAGAGVNNDMADLDSGSSVYNLKAGYILRSLACVYCEMKDYLYATGLFASAERAFTHHYGPNSLEVLDLLALQETYQRRIGASREGEMTFKKMMNVVAERKKNGLL